ncbi:MAG TPA: dTDP-4-dehydrorhamnose 3,5-epimerase [Blastocatellia bacterium]|nr:dTDP-4-dehydrorhamnose 3,5-epimerase [Blastocatellia bacterium]
MIYSPTAIKDVWLIEPKVFGDVRGFFMETYRAHEFAEKTGVRCQFVQDNHSGSEQGTLRGLHYQIKQPQGKLVRVLAGAIYDVAVDIRRHSPTFGQWVAAELSSENRQQIWVPPGFAHGFYVLSEWAEVAYKTTDYYAPEWERTIKWDDPELKIEWPLIDCKPPRLSAKDEAGKRFSDAELFD